MEASSVKGSPLTAEQAISEARDFLSGFEGCDINGAHVAPILDALRKLPADFIVLRLGWARPCDTFVSDTKVITKTASWDRASDWFPGRYGFDVHFEAVDSRGRQWSSYAFPTIMDDFGTLVEVQTGGAV